MKKRKGFFILLGSALLLFGCANGTARQDTAPSSSVLEKELPVDAEQDTDSSSSVLEKELPADAEQDTDSSSSVLEKELPADARQEKGNPSADGKEPLSVESQLKLIAASGETWRLEYAEKEAAKLEEGSTYQGSEFYEYTVCDLDQNGRLEIVSSTVMGNGYYCVNEFYQVDEEGKALEEISCGEGDDSQVQIEGGTENVYVYIDKEEPAYHYLFEDLERGSAVDHTMRYQDITLDDGRLKGFVICSWSSHWKKMGKKEKEIIKYYSGEFKKQIAEKKCLRLMEDYYKGMQKKTAKWKWFSTLEEGDRLYFEDASVEERLKVPDKAELYRRLKDSYEAFRIMGK